MFFSFSLLEYPTFGLQYLSLPNQWPQLLNRTGFVFLSPLFPRLPFRLFFSCVVFLFLHACFFFSPYAGQEKSFWFSNAEPTAPGWRVVPIRCPEDRYVRKKNEKSHFVFLRPGQPKIHDRKKTSRVLLREQCRYPN